MSESDFNPERIPFPRFRVLTWERIRLLGRRIVSFMPLEAPDYMSEHNRPQSEEWTLFDLQPDVDHQLGREEWPDAS